MKCCYVCGVGTSGAVDAEGLLLTNICQDCFDHIERERQRDELIRGIARTDTELRVKRRAR